MKSAYNQIQFSLQGGESTVQSKRRELKAPHSKARAILTAEQAVKIYEIKLANHTATKSQILSPGKVARAFGVSEKAVRDIWNGRTWLRETTRLSTPGFGMEERRSLTGLPHCPELRSASKDLCSDDCMLHRTTMEFNAGPNLTPEHISVQTSTAAGQNVHGWWDAVKTTDIADGNCSPSHSAPFATKTTTGPVAAIQYQCCSGRSLLADEVTPLPVSSREDDPFHDDWRYWSAKGSVI